MPRPQWNTPNRAIIRQDRLEKFAPYRDADGALDLQALAADANFTVARNSSISYGAVIDSFLNNKSRAAKDISFVHMTFPLQMLADERIDLIFSPLESWYSPEDFSRAMQDSLSEGQPKK